MPAGEGHVARADDDDPSTASDALSLHTIAEADAYAAQEQEDADFALALALEEQESQRYAHAQNVLQGQDPNQVAVPPPEQTDTALPPYRDDPDAVILNEGQADNPLPYRDDPDAPVEEEADERDTEPVKRPRAFLRVFRKLFKTWLCCVMWSTMSTIIILVVVLGLLARFGNKGSNPKEAAWIASRSKDYQLRVWNLYPPLEADATKDCKEAWRVSEETQSLGCHRMILSSAWDTGDSDEVKAEEADPFFYSEAVCTATCQGQLQRMAASLDESCKLRTDRFNLVNYGKNGKAYFEKNRIEEGPAFVARNLMDRYNHFCKKPNANRYRLPEWGTCAADLWMKWGVVDGNKEAHLNGLDQFLEQTSVKKTIPSETRTMDLWDWTSSGGSKTRTIEVSSRRVGPGSGETYCGFCTVDWLERKMRSFEFGQIRDPASGEALGLSEFREKLRSALRRCSTDNGALRRIDRQWEELGWWCDGKPCSFDKPEFSTGTLAILHGWSRDDDGPRGLRNLIEKKAASKNVLKGMQVLHDAMLAMPCGIGFSEIVAKHEIMPHEHIVGRLCSAPCRNALDRLNSEHGPLFAKLRSDRDHGHIFQYSTLAADMVDKVCLSPSPNAAFQASENLCAPGYAAVGHPEWIFASKSGNYDPPVRGAILDAFSKEIDALAARLPERVSPPKTDPESARIQAKKLAESACNTCAGGIFIGSEPHWKKTVNEYLDDRDVNGTKYVAAAKKGWVTCGKMYGKEFSDLQKKMMWREYGLDRYD